MNEENWWTYNVARNSQRKWPFIIVCAQYISTSFGHKIPSMVHELFFGLVVTEIMGDETAINRLDHGGIEPIWEVRTPSFSLLESQGVRTARSEAALISIALAEHKARSVFSLSSRRRHAGV